MKSLFFTIVLPPSSGPTPVNGQKNILASTLQSAISAALSTVDGSTFNSANKMATVTLDARPTSGRFAAYIVNIRKSGSPDKQECVLAVDQNAAITAAVTAAGDGADGYGVSWVGNVDLEAA